MRGFIDAHGHSVKPSAAPARRPLAWAVTLYALPAAAGAAVALGGQGGQLSPLLAFGLPLALAYCWALLRHPLPTLCLCAAFVLAQELLVLNVGGAETAVGGLLKHVDEYIIAVSFGTVLAWNLLTGWPRSAPEVRGVMGGVAAFLAAGLIGNLLNRVPGLLSLQGAFLAVKGFLWFYVVASLPFTVADFERFAKFIFFAGLVVLAGGVIDFAAPEVFRAVTNNIGYVDYRGGLPSVVSFFTHPGVFGWFTAFAACLGFADYFARDRRRGFWVGLVFALASLLSMRRKPLAGLALALAVGLLLSPRPGRLRRALVILCLATAVFFAFSDQLGDLYRGLLEHYVLVPDSMSVARNALYQVAGRIAVDYFPLGVGFGRYGSWMSRVHYSPVYGAYGLDTVWGLGPGQNFLTDTFWPMILGETGALGLAAIAFALARLVGGLSARLRALPLNPLLTMGPDGERSWAALAALMVLLEALVESVADPVFVRPPQNVLVFALVGLAYALNRSEARQ